MLESLKIPSPIQKINNSLLERNKIELLVKRDDLIHPTVSGNKWRKLKYNIEEALSRKVEGIITFGGAFSNHIYSSAAVASLAGIKSVGIIRGEIDSMNPTLIFARSQGMELLSVSRSDYRMKEGSPAVQAMLAEYINYYLIPEGGSNALAIKGVEEIAIEIKHQLPEPPDYIVVSAGTGSTAAGIINTCPVKKEILVVSALKGNFLIKDIEDKLSYNDTSWSLITDYHFGGYGKTKIELIDFINRWSKDYQLPLDPIYNGKSVYGLMDMIEKGRIEQGSRVLYIHTGGLQGREGYNYMNNNGVLINLP